MSNYFRSWTLLLVLTTLFSFVPAVVAAPAAQTGDAPTPGCQWVYSAGGRASFANLLHDTESTPLDDLYFGEPFGTSNDLTGSGHLDFDGDGRQDLFRVKARPDGLQQWQYSPDSRNPWQNLAHAAAPLTDLHFGDFDNDGKSDVFGAYLKGDGGHRWLYSSGGTANFQTLKEISADEATRYSAPRIADFNGDGKADIFVAEPRPAGGWQWKYAPGGSADFINLAYALVDPALLQFGDFEGNLKSDVFAILELADGGQQWVYSSGGTANFQVLQTITADEVAQYGTPRLGDFDNDGKTDIFITGQRSDGAWQWAFAAAGSGGFSTRGMAYATVPPADLRFGRFDASADDTVTDVFALLGCDSMPTLPTQPLACGGESNASADATVDEGAANQPTGTLSQLAIARTGGRHKQALLRFDLDWLSSDVTITSAEIELPLVGAPGASLADVNVTEIVSAWDEATVSWQSRPELGYDYGAKSTTTASGRIRVDVTPLVIRWVNEGVPQLGVLLGPGGGAEMQLTVASREADGDKPKLIVHCTARYAGNPPDPGAKDQAQQADLTRLRQASAVAPEVTFGLQGGVLNAGFDLTIPNGVDEQSESRARWFLTEYKGLLRLTDPDSQLELVQRDDVDSHPRFRQLVEGVPVEGGELVVHLAGDHVTGVTGFYMPDMVPLGAPTLNGELAASLAMAHAGNGSTTIGEPQLRYVTERMVNPAADPRSRIAWLVSISGKDGWYYYLIDAQSGRILATIPQQTTAFNLALRRVFGAGPTGTNCSTALSSANGTLWYTAAGIIQGVASNPDANAAFNAIRATYTYWNRTRGIRRDGIDGNGGVVNVYVGVGANWRNAQWTCGQIEVGAGMATQDFIAHEWGHGIMAATVSPIYQREPGALNESLADLFGYALDPDDWTIGEGTIAGTQRDMEFPSRFGQPDTMAGFQPLPNTTPCNGAIGGNDSCLVHTNSGIHNKAVQLLIEGGEHNGIEVRAMGRDKAVALYYNALRLNQITSRATFFEMRVGVLNIAKLSRVSFIDFGLGWRYSEADTCSIRNAYAAVGVGSGDADCDGTENPAESQWWADADGDGIRNDLDRCPNLASPNNADTDGDTVGDACDSDDDNDAVCDFNGPLSGNIAGVPSVGCQRGQGLGAGYVFDNCPLVRNSDQGDLDDDNRGNACDKDIDGDGRADALDNCPGVKQGLVKNDWNDYDGDGVGDVCDWDSDNDGICNQGGPWTFGNVTPGVPMTGCKASPWIVNGVTADICPLKEDPDQEDSTETARGKAADLVGDACDLCPDVSDPDNSDTDEDGVGDACDLDDDNDHICDTNGPYPPGALGVIADPRDPRIGCEPGPDRRLSPIRPADNCPKVENRNQRDDDGNGRGFACDPAEQEAWQKRLGQAAKGLKFKVRYGPQRFPIPICPQCGRASLPFNYESVINVQVPDGYRAQVVDNFGKVFAASQVSGGMAELRFQPGANAARQIGFGVQSAAVDDLSAALVSASDVTYFVELIPEASLDPDLEVETTITVSEATRSIGAFVPMILR